MIQLFDAIYKKFDSSVDFYNALSGRFSYGRAKKNSEYPYAVYSSYATGDESTFSAEIDDVPIQMNIYSDDLSHSSCFELLKQCKELFRDTVLTVEDHENITLSKVFEVPPIHDGDVWMAVIEFNCLLQAI